MGLMPHLLSTCEPPELLLFDDLQLYHEFLQSDQDQVVSIKI